MTATSVLQDAFAHHVWATIRLIDACEQLESRELGHAVPGTRGPIIETLAHIVDGDTWDLDVLERRSVIAAEEAGLDLSALRETTQRNGRRWSSFISGSGDLDAVIPEVDPTDGFRRLAPAGMRLAAALDHGTDHRSQICTNLTSLGVAPPAIDVWTFGVELGRIEETPGTS